MKFTELLTDVGRPVAYYPSLARLLGSVNSAILLCQLVYWVGKGNDPDGWIYKTSDEFGKETGLSYGEQRTARKRLRDKGLLEERYARLEHVIFYRLNLDALNELWEQSRDEFIASERKKRISRTSKSHFGNRQNLSSGTSKLQFVNQTETTTQTTPKISSEKEAAAATAPPSPPASSEHGSLSFIEEWYEDTFGKTPTPYVKRKLETFARQYGSNYVIAAMQEAGKANVLRLSYVEEVLKRWSVEGAHTPFGPDSIRRYGKRREAKHLPDDKRPRTQSKGEDAFAQARLLRFKRTT